jgi:hypothetical protein
VFWFSWLPTTTIIGFRALYDVGTVRPFQGDAMNNTVTFGTEFPIVLRDATEVLKLEQTLIRYDRLHTPLIRITFTDGFVKTVRLGEADNVTTCREAVAPDAVAIISQEVDECAESGVVELQSVNRWDIFSN